MATPRRRLVRPVAVAAGAVQQRARRVQRLRAGLADDRQALDRWMSRLRRAFHAVEKLQAKIGRAERQVSRLEDQS